MSAVETEAPAAEPETYQRAYQPKSALAALGKALFRHRGLIPLPFIVGTLVTLLLFGDTVERFGVPFWASAAGFVLFCGSGHALRVWAIGYAGKETRRVRIAASKLATSGPFAYTRNPIYLGNLLIAVGLGLISRTTWVLVSFPILLFLQYHAIIRYEEEYLGATFGDEYREYARRTPRYAGWARGDLGDGGFDASQTLRKEYQAVLATVGTALAFLACRWAQ